MPVVTGFVDDLRQAFGAEQIDGAIRLGMKGRPYFWAREGEHEIGTMLPGTGGADDGDVADRLGAAGGAGPGGRDRVAGHGAGGDGRREQR